MADLGRLSLQAAADNADGTATADELIDIAEAAEEAGRPDEARDAYERALCLDPTLTAAATNLAVLRKHSGDLGSARALHLQAQSQDPSLRIVEPQRLLDGGVVFGMCVCEDELRVEAAATLRALLLTTGFAAAARALLPASEHGGPPTAIEYFALRLEEEVRNELTSRSQPLGVCLLLFLLGTAVPASQVHLALQGDASGGGSKGGSGGGAPGVDELVRLGLLQRVPTSDQATDSDGLLASPVQIYPLLVDDWAADYKAATEGSGGSGAEGSGAGGSSAGRERGGAGVSGEPLLIATDWPLESLLPAKTAVMPVGVDSLNLFLLVPRAPGARVLDLCCGGGIQATEPHRRSAQQLRLSSVPVMLFSVPRCMMDPSRALGGSSAKETGEMHGCGNVVLCPKPSPSPRPFLGAARRAQLCCLSARRRRERASRALLPLQRNELPRRPPERTQASVFLLSICLSRVVGPEGSSPDALGLKLAPLPEEMGNFVRTQLWNNPSRPPWQIDLNELGHCMRVAIGDVYQALGPNEHPFDLILANPPFVAVPRPPPGLAVEAQWALFADGGPDGADVLRAVLRGADSGTEGAAGSSAGGEAGVEAEARQAGGDPGGGGPWLRDGGSLAISTEIANVRTAHEWLLAGLSCTQLLVCHNPQDVQASEASAPLASPPPPPSPPPVCFKLDESDILLHGKQPP